MRDDDFVLYAGGKPHRTPAGHEISHPNARLLRQCINQTLCPPAGRITLLQLLEITVDSLEQMPLFPREAAAGDPLLTGDRSLISFPGADALSEDPGLSDFLFINSASLASAILNFEACRPEQPSRQELLAQAFREATPGQRAGWEALRNVYNAGLMIHLLLLEGFLSLSEYASGLLFLTMKESRSTGGSLWDRKAEAGGDTLRTQILSDAATVVDFLMLSGNENKTSVVEEIIRRGEDSQTEFKSTLRWDIRQGIKNPAIEHAALKTICAFLNSEGGDLMIGVRDDGSIEGIETDQFANNDRFLLHFWTLVRNSLGEEAVEWIRTSLQPIGHKTVCRVNCRKAGVPMFLRQKGFEEAFYIRVGPGSNSLEISSALRYIDQHFKDNL